MPSPTKMYTLYTTGKGPSPSFGLSFLIYKIRSLGQMMRSPHESRPSGLLSEY